MTALFQRRIYKDVDACAFRYCKFKNQTHQLIYILLCKNWNVFLEFKKPTDSNESQDIFYWSLLSICIADIAA